MMNAITALHNSEEVLNLLRTVEATQLLRSVGGIADLNTQVSPVAKLRVAAMLAFAQFIGDEGVDTRLRRYTSENGSSADEANASSVFAKWLGYIQATIDDNDTPPVEDLLFFVAVGLLARKPTEVRTMLRLGPIRKVLDDVLNDTTINDWANQVRRDVSLALLYTVRQENHDDVALAGRIVIRLVERQKLIEAEWLENQVDPQRDALSLLGLYHLAQAVARMSEFLLVGSVETDGRIVTDFAPELRRLLVRAEEYIIYSNDLELHMWLSTIAVVLLQLRNDSIWVSGWGISERLDQLLVELARQGRQQPVFSLLPSQQEALRQNLLDRTQVAIVLQMPTSAGKTLLAEFAIVQAFDAYKKGTRVVYVTPTRALATQVRRTLTEDLRPLQIQVSAAGSAFEEDPFELNLLDSEDAVIVATPEKLDLMLRAHPAWFDTLRLIVVDEAHLLKDSERGVRLELLLANLRREQPHARLLLLTPFMDNAREVASWLGSIGSSRSVSISVQWRPSRLLLGLAKISGRGSQRVLTVDWKDPNSVGREPIQLSVPTQVPSTQVTTTEGKVVYLAEQFQRLGTILALYSASPAGAEKAATKVAEMREPLPASIVTPALRFAISLARDEYGSASTLAYCLERGVAFHHRALSQMLRNLIEDQTRAGTIRFISATTTLAQGMNFPVSTVLVHSVHKPHGKGSLSPGEFWNIAGRAGRVGLADKGLVIFCDPHHQPYWEEYSKSVSESLTSALLAVLKLLDSSGSLKDQYREYPAVRPFFQYLAHTAAKKTPATALADVDELIQASLANLQVKDTTDARTMRNVARRYLGEILSKNSGYLKVADTTGLGSFSFDELYANISKDDVLMKGPGQVLKTGLTGISRLIDVLKKLPELSLGVGIGPGEMDVHTVARVVQNWMDGKSIQEIAVDFPGDEVVDKIRAAGIYLYSTVSQTVSWGAHAYIRGWQMKTDSSDNSISSGDAMLPAYIQYGVHSPEAAVASLLGVPRQFAEPIAAEFRKQHGTLKPEDASKFKSYVEQADNRIWELAVSQSSMANSVDPADVRSVWRRMQGYN